MKEKLRNSGIDSIGNIPWGTHSCQFYQTKEDLMDILVPYFKAGLENNELCIWIISEPLNIEEVKKALKRAVPDFDIYLEKGQIEIIPCTDWYLKKGVFNSERDLNDWVEKFSQVRTNGYDGMRATENTCWLEKEYWNKFVDYEERLDSIVNKSQMLFLCTYCLEELNITETIDVISNHQISLIKKKGKWEQIENSRQKKITERKQAKRVLYASEERYRSLYENSLDGILLTRPDGTILSANPQACYLFGMTEDEIIQAGREDLVVRDERLAAALEERELTGRAKAELTFKRKNGSTFVSETSSSFFKDADGSIKTNIIIRDITERKRAEEAQKKVHDNLEELVKERTTQLEKAYNSLKESKKGLAEAQKMAHIGNWDLDLVTDKVYWSDETYHIFGLIPQEFYLTYDKVLCYVHPNDRNYVENSIRENFNGKPCDIDYRIILANGEERIVHTHVKVAFDEKNNPILMRGTVQDITERKKAEKAMEKIEEARIKEIHHRIKNNLQVISSLLSLEADRFNDSKVLNAFKESQNRVASMALIHEELYRGKGTDNLDFAAYLQKLTADLFGSYNLRNDDISLKLNLEQVDLSIDTAIPLGIIVNELVSNSLKHAFVDGRKGEMSITLQRAEDFTINRVSSEAENGCKQNNFHYMLTVKDNGKGIPEEINFQAADSLGLQLVSILVEQIDGCIELRRDQGTEFMIWFSNNTEK